MQRMQSIQNFKRCEARQKANDEGFAKEAETVSKAKNERLEIVERSQKMLKGQRFQRKQRLQDM